MTAGNRWADGFVPSDIPLFALDLDTVLPFGDGTFGLVICGDGIEHLENPFAFFREFSRVLADGETLVGVARDDDKLFGEGHINPLTLIRTAYMAENSGLDLVRSTTALRKPPQYVLAPSHL